VSKEALSVVPCPFFLKKKFCRFHEVGQCWYEHPSGSTPAGEVLQVQEAPDPPPSSLPLSFPQTNAEPLPPRTTSVVTADFGTQTVPAPIFNANTQTAPALPLGDKATQTGPQDLIAIIEDEQRTIKQWMDLLYVVVIGMPKRKRSAMCCCLAYRNSRCCSPMMVQRQ
jgi:hypothetical protein